MSAADEIKAKLDIVDYIGRSVSLKRAGRYYKACCPFHHESTPSFVVNPDTQTWRCFGACAKGGDIFNFAMEQQGWTFSESLEELGKVAGVEVRQQSPAQKVRTEHLDTLRGLMRSAADFFYRRLAEGSDAEAKSALHYAQEKRGLSHETLYKFGVGHAPAGWHGVLEHLKALGYKEDLILESGMAVRNDTGRVYDRFRNRLMIPICDERGNVTGFGARALNPDDNPKYLNSPQTPLFDKSKTLFGLDIAKHAIRDSETAVIVEGYMDAIQAHQSGFANVVAQMGTAMTEAQLKQLAPRLANKLIIALDSDAAGQSATMRGLEVARETLQNDYSGRLSVDIRILQIPGAKDPDDLLREAPGEWQKLVNDALPVADYVIAVETASLPPNATVQEREAVALRVLPILAASENKLYQKANIQKLALKLRIAEADLLYWATEQNKIDAAKQPRPQIKTSPPKPVTPVVTANNSVSSPDDYIPEPPPDLDENGVYIPEWDAPPKVAARPKTMHAGRAVAMEAYCLRMLITQPDLFYKVNRKMRELATANPTLADSALGTFCVDDFTEGDHRRLMQGFVDALGQHQYAPLEYLRVTLDETLQPELDAILVHELEDLMPRLRHGLSIDLTSHLKQRERYNTPMDAEVELIDKALRLRVLRLKRELESLSFLQLETQLNTQALTEWADHERFMALTVAKGLIDTELQRQTSIIRD